MRLRNHTGSTPMNTRHTELGVCRTVFQLPSNQVIRDIACHLFGTPFCENLIEFNGVSKKNLQDPMGRNSPQKNQELA